MHLPETPYGLNLNQPEQQVLGAYLMVGSRGVAEGILRPLYATQDSQIAMICNLADELEAAQGTTPFEKSGKEFTLNALDGVWQLVFSSAFKNGNLGGNQPGPFSFQLLGSPISLERVFQRICVQKVYDIACKLHCK